MSRSWLKIATRLARLAMILFLALSLQGCPVMIAAVTGIFIASKAGEDKEAQDPNNPGENVPAESPETQPDKTSI